MSESRRRWLRRFRRAGRPRHRLRPTGAGNRAPFVGAGPDGNSAGQRPPETPIRRPGPRVARCPFGSAPTISFEPMPNERPPDDRCPQRAPCCGAIPPDDLSRRQVGETVSERELSCGRWSADRCTGRSAADPISRWPWPNRPAAERSRPTAAGIVGDAEHPGRQHPHRRLSRPRRRPSRPDARTPRRRGSMMEPHEARGEAAAGTPAGRTCNEADARRHPHIRNPGPASTSRWTSRRGDARCFPPACSAACRVQRSDATRRGAPPRPPETKSCFAAIGSAGTTGQSARTARPHAPDHVAPAAAAVRASSPRPLWTITLPRFSGRRAWPAAKLLSLVDRSSQPFRSTRLAGDHEVHGASPAGVVVALVARHGALPSIVGCSPPCAQITWSRPLPGDGSPRAERSGEPCRSRSAQR